MMKQYNLEVLTLDKRFYESIPSGSGLEFYNDVYYLMGDDSPYLYELDGNFKLVQQYALFDTAAFGSGRIPKSLKPDLECMARFTYGRDEYLLLLGSGASAERNRGFLVNLTDNMQVREVDLSRLYLFLKKVLKIEGEGLLNVEGLAMDANYTYLMQRSFGARSNVLFRFETDDFIDYFFLDARLPVVAVYYFNLPQLQYYHAGFSGAYALDGRLFFTASVEATTNAIDDAQVLGSYIGMIDLGSLPYATDPVHPASVPIIKLSNPDGSAYLGKAESLVLGKVAGAGEYRVIVVSDDDAGHTELLELQLSVQSLQQEN